MDIGYGFLDACDQRREMIAVRCLEKSKKETLSPSLLCSFYLVLLAPILIP